jgi:DNA-binding NarL/FixJ family response regulator
MSQRNTSDPIRLLLVDDHAVMRTGLANMLASSPGFCVIGEADEGAAAVAFAQSHQPDVILLDLMMPGMSGLECLKQLRECCPECKVLILTSSEFQQDIKEALAAGASGYVIKTARPQELMSAIVSVSEGGQYVSAEIAKCLDSSSSYEQLTAREIEVLHLLRKGMSNADIGLALRITPRTAKAHVAAILQKTQAQDRAEAVARGFELGFLKAL